jgi:hypothetical protein
MFNKVKVLSTLLVLVPVLGMAATQIKCPSAAAKAVKFVSAIPYNAGYEAKTADNALKNAKGIAYTLFIANINGSSPQDAVVNANLKLQNAQLHEPTQVAKFGHDFCVYYGDPALDKKISIAAIRGSISK